MILVSQFEKGNDATRKRIYDLYLSNTQYINNRDLVDLSAPQIVGGYLEIRSRKPLYRLAKAPSLWERRIAILATFRFIRLGDFADTLKIAEILLGDEEDLTLTLPSRITEGWMSAVGSMSMPLLLSACSPEVLRSSVVPNAITATMNAATRTMFVCLLWFAVSRFPQKVISSRCSSF